MKFYIYISKPKIDMLFSQLRNHSKSKLLREIDINTKLVNLKQKSEYDTENITAKTRIVTEHIKASENMGTILNPNNYIYDNLNMYITPLGYPSTNMLAVSGKKDDSVIILGASKKHFIGNSSKSYDDNLTSVHFMLIFSEYLSTTKWNNSVSKRAKEKLYFGHKFFFHCVDFVRFQEEHRMPYQNLEFLAKTLTVGIDDESGKKIVIATPVYIANN